MGFEEQIRHENTWSRAIGDPVFGYGTDVVGAPADVKTGSDLLGPTLGVPTRGLDASSLALGFTTKATSGTARATTDKQRLDDALATANEHLTGWAPNGAGGMKALTALPAHLQSEAISRLSRDEFDMLLGSMSDTNREGLKVLVDNVKDPQRKLELWGCYHKAHANLDVDRFKGDTGNDPYLKSADQWEQQRRHAMRGIAANTTGKEVDEEVMNLVNGVVKGTPMTLDMVNELIARKDKEHAMEMKYNVNLTNQVGGRVATNKGSHVHWSKGELDVLDGSFSQMGDEHLRGSKLLSEIRREETDFDDKKKPDSTTGGWHNKDTGLLVVTDSGARLTGSSFRAGSPRELADPALARSSPKTTPLDMTIIHELGHDVHDQNDAAFEKYKAASGWKSLPTGAGLSDEDKKMLDGERKKNYSQRKMVNKDGKLYMVDPYNNKAFLEVDADALPKSSEAKVAPGTDADPWQYARSNFKDHFAEHYSKAVHTPETVHHDLVAAPHKVVTDKENEIERLQALKAAYKTLDVTERERAEVDNEIRLARNDLKRAEATEKKRAAQFGIMRNDVFHTDKEQAGAEARLKAKGISDVKMKEFKAKAATVSTPAQLKRIEATF